MRFGSAPWVVAVPGLMAVVIPAFPTAPVHISPNYDHRRFWRHESPDLEATSDELWSQRGLPGF